MSRLKKCIIDCYLFKMSFSDLGEALMNNKVIGKILRVMLRRSRWEALVSALEAMQGTNNAFTSDELYTHLRCFEEKLKQAGDYYVEPKQVAFPCSKQCQALSTHQSHAKTSSNHLIMRFSKMSCSSQKCSKICSTLRRNSTKKERNMKKM
jgi:hypothetical protein